MKKSSCYFILTLCLLTISICGVTEAQWVQTSGPYGGQINCFAVSGTNLFAGTHGGDIFRSTDDGASWTKVNTRWGFIRVFTLAVNGSNLFVGTDGKGVFRSADNGESWTEVNTGLANKSVHTLVVNGLNLFAGTNGGVFRSADNGASWTEINTGLTNYYVYDLAVSGTNLFAGTFGGGVFLSADNGASWTEVNTGLTNKNVRALAVSGTNLFAGTYDGVFLSANNGDSWTEVNTGLANHYVYALAVSGSNLFAGTNSGGVFRSEDNGASWSEVNNGLTNKVVQALVVSGTNLFAGTYGSGVFCSTDNGASWSKVNTGFSNSIVRALTVSGSNLFAGTGGGGVFRSPDNGASWSEVNSGLTNTAVYSFAVSGTNLFAGTNGGVFLSPDNGASWSEVNTGLAISAVYALAVSGTNLFAGTISGGMFRSENNGASWTEVNTGLTNITVRALAVSGSNLFAGTEGGVFLSTNNGANWTAVNIGLTNSVVPALAVSGSNLFAGTMGGGVFLSTNNGANWTAVNNGLTNLVVWDLTVSGSDIFAGTSEGVFISANNGASWTEVNTSLMNRYVYALAVSGSNLFAGAAYSVVCRRPIPEMIASAALDFHRGMNIFGWFDEPRSGQININRYTEEDFQILKTMGYDAVRVWIDLLHMAGPAPGYELDSLFLEFLDIAVDRAEAAGLFIVMDNHSWDPIIGIDPSIEPVLLAAWTQMASHYKNRSNLVMYEVLNEPHGISDADWNTIQEHAIEAIRTEDGFHTIVVTPANWSGYDNLDALPEYTDDNLLYTFHFYAPHLFTHQGTTWGDPVPEDLTGVSFPYDSLTMPPLPESLQGTWWEDMYNDYPDEGNEAWVKSQLDIADQFQSERNVRLWCGEFGAYEPASPSEDRAAWIGIVRTYTEGKGIAWAATDGPFEANTAGCFETDIDTVITSALGLTAPDQKEPASEPETSGFTFYDDFMSHGLFKSGWFSSGEFDLYSKESPHEGESCLKITGFEQYGTLSFRFCPYRDLSFLVNHGSTLDFWVRCASPGTQIEIRFEDTKTSDPDDHPWRMVITLSSSNVDWDGEWHYLSIPLKNFVDVGSWDNNQWYNSQGLFDWKATDRLVIDAAHHSLDGIEIFFDDIRISDPIIEVRIEDKSPEEYQLLQNYPNPFNQSTTISYSLKKSDRVSLRIYDLMGREITTLVNEYQIPDTYTVRFDASDLAGGIYYYQLRIGNDFSRTNKMVLLK
jgi:photosystem II stability/assembly factor-like uncharacterized protein